MTVVVADSSPLNYLTLIGSVDLLHQLYDTIVVPRQVIAELTDDEAPREVRDWAINLPHWIDVRVTTEINEAGRSKTAPTNRWLFDFDDPSRRGLFRLATRYSIYHRPSDNGRQVSRIVTRPR